MSQQADKYKSNYISYKSHASINNSINNPKNKNNNKFQSFYFIAKKNIFIKFKNKNNNKTKISNDSLNKEFKDILISNSYQKYNFYRMKKSNYKNIINNLWNKSDIFNTNKKLKLSLIKNNLKEISIPHQNISQKMITEIIKP